MTLKSCTLRRNKSEADNMPWTLDRKRGVWGFPNLQEPPPGPQEVRLQLEDLGSRKYLRTVKREGGRHGNMQRDSAVSQNTK